MVDIGKIAACLREATERTAKKMDFPLEEEGLARLCVYMEELARWNRAYNLVGRGMGPEGLVELCIDAITPLCIEGLLAGEKEVLDIGSGAGMPGIPVYLLAGPFPLTLVEAQRKKVTFLRHIRRKLGLDDIRIFPGRAEDMCRDEDHLNTYEVALVRAAMEPSRAIKLARPLLCEGGQLVLFLGEKDAERIRRNGAIIEAGGMKVKAVRSTKRYTSRENHLVQLIKK